MDNIYKYVMCFGEGPRKPLPRVHVLEKRMSRPAEASLRLTVGCSVEYTLAL